MAEVAGEGRRATHTHTQPPPPAAAGRVTAEVSLWAGTFTGMFRLKCKPQRKYLHTSSLVNKHTLLNYAKFEFKSVCSHM